MTPQPDSPPPVGELVRAHRMYIGLSQRAFATKLGIPEKSLSDIEIGRRSGTQRFLDYVIDQVDEFDEAVKLTVTAAEDRLKHKAEETVHIEVDDESELEAEWQRAVIGRAAVESGLIVPLLVGRYARASR